MALPLLSVALLGVKDARRWSIVWLGFNLAFELAQGLSLIAGTFDWGDFLAAFVGAGCAAMLTQGVARGTEWVAVAWRRVALTVLYTGGLLSMMATSASGPRYTPIYMSYEDLRASFAVEPPHAMDTTGKILLADNLLMVVEPNQGVHVVDNTHPAEPTQLAFLRVLGCLDIAMVDGLLYADSYVDLLAVDLGNVDDITLASRTIDVLPYDAYRHAPQGTIDGIDGTQGVIIDVQPRGYAE